MTLSVTGAQPTQQEEQEKKKKQDVWDKLLTGVDLGGSATGMMSDFSAIRENRAAQAAKGSGYQNEAMQRRINRTA